MPPAIPAFIQRRVCSRCDTPFSPGVTCRTARKIGRIVRPRGQDKPATASVWNAIDQHKKRSAVGASKVKPAAGDLVVRLCAAGGVAAVNTHHCYQEVVCVCGHRSRLPFGARQRPVSSRRHTSKQGRAQAAHGSDPVQPSTKASLGTPGSGGVNSDVPAAATAGQTGSDAVPTATPTPQMAAAKTPGEHGASSSKPLKPKATARKTPGAFCRAHAPLNVAAWHPTHHLCETFAAGQALAPSLQSPQPVGAERRTRRSGACTTHDTVSSLSLLIQS